MGCVPSLMQHPKWFESNVDPKMGDVVLYFKLEKEFKSLYQDGLITDLKVSRDGRITQVDTSTKTIMKMLTVRQIEVPEKYVFTHLRNLGSSES